MKKPNALQLDLLIRYDTPSGAAAGPNGKSLSAMVRHGWMEEIPRPGWTQVRHWRTTDAGRRALHGQRGTTVMSDEEIVRGANELARKLYRLMGCVVPKGYRFDKATHPQERICWHMAAAAFEQLLGTDIDDAVANTEDEG